MLETNGNTAVNEQGAAHVGACRGRDFQGVNAHAETIGDNAERRIQAGGKRGAQNVARVGEVVVAADRLVNAKAPGLLLCVARDDQAVEGIVGSVVYRSRAICNECFAGDASIAQDIAYVQIGLDRLDDALTNLERAVDERSERVLWLRVDSKVDRLRGNARFEQLIQRIGGLD